MKSSELDRRGKEYGMPGEKSFKEDSQVYVIRNCLAEEAENINPTHFVSSVNHSGSPSRTADVELRRNLLQSIAKQNVTRDTTANLLAIPR